ncbi:MAG TPA: heme biosynthesis HemY N-terminal domain-containing protein [Gammaproteobacteria bacterium]|nr:heme biosynthesis HemY N-terminal domain-containing protein [Gammaproteobacteria bacterium]
MLRLIVILIVLIASVLAGAQLAQHPGYVFISYQQQVIEMPLWFVVIGLIIIFLVFHVLLRSLAFIHNLDMGFRGWWRRRRSAKAYDKTQRGMLEILEEHWVGAEQHLLQGVTPIKNPVVNYLLAAKAAYEQKAFERADAYLQKAYQAAPEDEIIIGIMQARFQFGQGHLEQAQMVLARLRKIAPYHPAVLKTLERIYIQAGLWNQLLELLPYLRKAKAISRYQAAIFERNIYCELLKETRSKSLGAQTARELWHKIPKKIRLHPDVVQLYAELLQEDNVASNEVEPLIRKILNRSWREDLVKAYGRLKTSRPEYQLASAESWLKLYGNRPALILTAARLSMKSQLWGKAKAYLEEALSHEPSAEIQLELAKLLEYLGENQLALQHYRKGLEITVV